MATSFRGTTLKGYLEQDQKSTKWQVFEFPNSDVNRVFFRGRGLGVVRFKGFTDSVAEWNTIRGLFTDGVAGILQYRASRGDSAPDHKLTVFARLTGAQPKGSGWEYAVEFLAEDQVPTDTGDVDVY